MRVLLQNCNKEICERLAFAIESTFHAEVISVSDATDAKARLAQATEPVDLVVADLSGKPVELDEFFALTPKAVCAVFVDASLPEPVKVPKWSAVTRMPKGDWGSTLLKTIEDFIAKGLLSRVEVDEDFCRIRTRLLLSVCPLKSDIFIRLSKSKFVKLFNEGDNFEQTDLHKYTVKKGIEHLYLRNTDVQEFVDKYIADLRRQFSAAEATDSSENEKNRAAVYETTQELSRRVGFTRDVQVMAKMWVKSTIQTMERQPNLASILSRMRALSGQYLPVHSSMCAYTACAIASHLEWGSDTTFQKLTIASFLHDIAIVDNELARCSTLQEVRDRGFSKEAFKEFSSHPVKGAEIAKKFQEVPPDVDVIVMQHHEMGDGSGFPRHLTHGYIAPLAAVFIVAHDLADYILNKGTSFVVADFLGQVQEKYHQSVFKKVMEAVSRL